MLWNTLQTTVLPSQRLTEASCQEAIFFGQHHWICRLTQQPSGHPCLQTQPLYIIFLLSITVTHSDLVDLSVTNILDGMY